MGIESCRHHQDWDAWQHMYTYYQGLKRMGVDAEFVGDADVFAHYRQGLWVAVNCTDKIVSLPVPKDAKVLLGDRALPPAGVLLWKDAR